VEVAVGGSAALEQRPDALDGMDVGCTGGHLNGGSVMVYRAVLGPPASARHIPARQGPVHQVLGYVARVNCHQFMLNR
jgi:hypothetical protein